MQSACLAADSSSNKGSSSKENAVLHPFVLPASHPAQLLTGAQRCC
jgi:hypothetical protein